MTMTTQSFNRNPAQTNEERLAEYEAKVAAMPVEEQAKLRGREWQVTAQFALRFLQLEAEVAALKSALAK